MPCVYMGLFGRRKTCGTYLHSNSYGKFHLLHNKGNHERSLTLGNLRIVLCMESKLFIHEFMYKSLLWATICGHVMVSRATWIQI